MLIFSEAGITLVPPSATHLHQYLGISKGTPPRSEANHPEVFALLQFVAHVGPADDPARDHAGELADDENPARILERPGHRAILGRAIGVARVEAKAGVRFLVNDFAIDRRAIGVHIEDGKKYSHALLAGLQDFGLVDFDDVRDGAISGGHNRVRISRRNARRIAEEPKDVNRQEKNEQKKPGKKPRAATREAREPRRSTALRRVFGIA